MGSEESQRNAVLRRHDLCRFEPAKHWSRTLADQFPGVFEANPERQLWRSEEGEGRGPTIEPDLQFRFGSRWLPPSLNPM
jgi:hypothetical protein